MVFTDSSDPRMTVETLSSVMALVKPRKWKEVWDGFLPKSHLQMSQDIHQQSVTSASYYISHAFNPSWVKMYSTLYSNDQTGAMELVKPYLPPTSPGI